MEVVGVKQIAPLCFEPSSACLCLALRAAARTAGVVGDGCFVLTAFTLILVAAKSSSAAALHSPACLQLLIAENGLEALDKLPALAAEDIGNFKGRPRHRRACLLVTDNLHRPPNYSPATAAATAAPAASFSPATRTLQFLVQNRVER